MNVQPQYQTRTNLKNIPKRDELKYTERFNPITLERFRRMGDNYADTVVRQMHERYGLTNIRDLLSMVREKAAIEGEEGKPYREFIENSNMIPKWVNMEAVKKGQRVLAIHGGSNGQALFTGSLVGGSLFKSAAVVTALAGNLSSDPNRRVTETALIISNLMFVGSLAPGGKAWESLVRVRLLHSALRHWLQSSGRYDANKMNGEIPINQHDMAITLALFGYVNLRSLRRLNVILTKEENESFIHMWKYAGYILGIVDDLLPDSLEDQEEMFIASLKLSADPEWIPEQVRFVLDEMARKVNQDTMIIPESWAKDYLHQLTRYLSGNEYITGMKIEDKGDDHWTLMLARTLGRAETGFKWYFPFGESIMYNANTYLVSKMIHDHQKNSGGKLGAGMREAPSAYSASSKKSETSSKDQKQKQIDDSFGGLSSSSTCPVIGVSSSKL